jgi:hypothetical protein
MAPLTPPRPVAVSYLSMAGRMKCTIVPIAVAPTASLNFEAGVSRTFYNC